MPEQDAPTLLPAKAKELGCDARKGHFKALKDGKSVTLDDGTVVTSEQVCQAAGPSAAFMVVFLPNTGCIESFLGENEALFQKVIQLQALENAKFGLELIYHSVPAAAIQNPLYRAQFMTRFGPKIIHVLDC